MHWRNGQGSARLINAGETPTGFAQNDGQPVFIGFSGWPFLLPPPCAAAGKKQNRTRRRKRGHYGDSLPHERSGGEGGFETPVSRCYTAKRGAVDDLPVIGEAKGTACLACSSFPTTNPTTGRVEGINSNLSCSCTGRRTSDDRFALASSSEVTPAALGI
jgi:hypothetical protein